MTALRAALLTLGLACPARADPSLLSIEIGLDHLDVTAAQITTVAERNDLRGPIVFVQLDPSLQTPLSDLSAVHIGDLVILKVCGAEVEQGLLREQLTSAAIAITAISETTARHLAAVLAAKDCRNAPSS